MANKREIGFEWPIGLSLFDLRRIIWGRWTQRMPEVIADLAQKGVKLLLEDAYGIAREIQEVSDVSGFFILDEVREPERFNPPDLPACVLITQDGEFISPAKMQEILSLHHGQNLPEDLSSEERNVRVQQQRRRLVLTRRCRHDGCTETVVVTVGMAARAIEGHKLMEKGAPYEPPSLCKRHRAERDVALHDRRNKPHRRKKSKALGVIGDDPEVLKQIEAARKMLTDDDRVALLEAPPVDTSEDYAEQQRREGRKMAANHEPEQTKENTDGDCPIPAVAPVEEQAEL